MSEIFFEIIIKNNKICEFKINYDKNKSSQKKMYRVQLLH